MRRREPSRIAIALACACALALATDVSAQRKSRSDADEALLARLGESFRAFKTDHFVVYYNTHRTFARKRSLLLERLLRSYKSNLKKIGLELRAPDEKLTIILFDDKTDFQTYTGTHGSTTLAGVFMTDANQAVFFDNISDPGYQATKEAIRRVSAELAEYRDQVDKVRRSSVRESYLDQIRRMESQLALYNQRLDNTMVTENVGTVVHEAAHALSFNIGPFTRDERAMPPRWLVEGLATLFETPRQGRWRGAMRFNPRRYFSYAKALEAGRLPPLRRLLVSDELFLTPRNAETTYGATWALAFYLYHAQGKAFATLLASDWRLGEGNNEERAGPRIVTIFEDALGKSLPEIQSEWHKYMAKRAKRHRRELNEWINTQPR